MIESIYKVLVIGDPSVDITTLLEKFATKLYLSTVGVNIFKEMINLDEFNATVNLMLWDVAVQPQFYMLHRPYFNGADGMILIFDIARSSTFSNIAFWYSTAIKYGLSGTPKILVGIKKELNSEDERKITLPIAQYLSEKLKAPYFEVSLTTGGNWTTGENFNLILQKIAELIYTREQEFQPQSSPPHRVHPVPPTVQFFPHKDVEYKLKLIRDDEKELKQEVIDKKEVILAVEKIRSLMKEEQINELEIQRKYLPEIISLNLLGISKLDGLPKLKASVLSHFELQGIIIRYYGKVVNFLDEKEYFLERHPELLPKFDKVLVKKRRFKKKKK